MWEELADIGEFIGEELLEFLEKGAGISSDAETEGSDSFSPKSKNYSKNVGEDYKREDSRFNSGSASKSTAGKASQSTQEQYTSKAKKSLEEQVEDDLEALKRKLGLK